MTSETRLPKRKFYRRMAAFKVLGMTPDQSTWKQLKAKLTGELAEQYRAVIATVMGLTGPQVTAKLFGNGETATVAAAPARPAAKKSGAGKRKATVKPEDEPTPEAIAAMVEAQSTALEDKGKGKGKKAA